MPHIKDMYRTAARLLGNGGGVEDVVQDVYFAGVEVVRPIRVGDKLPCVAVQDSVSHSASLPQEMAKFPNDQGER